MAKKSNYDTNALYEGLMAQNQEVDTINSETTIENKEVNRIENQVPKKTVGRPAENQDYLKRSYYISRQHERAIKRCSADYDCDFSSVVRLAIEAFAKQNDNWEKK